MKKLLIIILSIQTFYNSTAQSVGIGTSTPNANAVVEIKSNSKGLLMPRLSTIARNSMSSVPKGMIVYDSSYNSFYFHDGGRWRPVSDNNADSLLKDNSLTPQVTANMAATGITRTLSGILYDNGGPSGNYSNNSSNQYEVEPIIATNSVLPVLYKVVVEEMNLESPYDSLEIYNSGDYAHREVFTGTRTGTFYFTTTGRYLRFVFKSNGVNNLSGFKIRWGLMMTDTTASEQAPVHGWYFNYPKIAVRGGINLNNNWNRDSLGVLSFAYGYNSKAKGRFSFAMGSGSNADGEGATAIGSLTRASGMGSVALGRNTSSAGIYSLAMGENSTASSQYSVAMGENAIASDYNAFAMGSNVTASGWGAVSMGNYTIASGAASFAAGSSTRAIGDFSVSMGIGTVSKAYGAIALGLLNDTADAPNQNVEAVTDRIFQVGNGTVSENKRHNALTILRKGYIGIATTTPHAPLQFANTIENRKIVLWEDFNNDYEYYGFGINSSTLRYNVPTNGIHSFIAGGLNLFNIYSNGNAVLLGTLTQISDARLKTTIVPLQHSLQSLIKLNGYSYYWKDSRKSKEQQIGVLAQELQKVFPQLVHTDNEGKLSVNYSGLIPVLIESTKELNDKIEKQQKQIDELMLLLKK
jgi:Chaperone of endosialidase/Head domain of trimeric autotransporter adhesin